MTVLEGSVDLPAVGPVKKQYLAVGAAGVGGFLVFAYVRRYRELAAAEAAPVYGEGFDEQGNLLGTFPYQPTTGPPGLFDQDDQRGTGFLTNAEWSQAAVDYLEEGGVERGAAQSALGKFLTGQQVTATEADWIRRALAGEGPPPQGEHVIRLAPGPPAATALPAPGGFSARYVGPGSASTNAKMRITWTPVSGAKDYVLRHVGGSTSIVTQTAHDVISARGRVDRWEVQARDANNIVGAKASLSFTAPTTGAAPGATKAPGAPSRVSARGGRNTATISWTRPAGATKFRIRRETRSAATSWLEIGNVTSYRASARVREATLYAWRVQAGNAKGWGGHRNSNTVRVTP